MEQAVTAGGQSQLIGERYEDLMTLAILVTNGDIVRAVQCEPYDPVKSVPTAAEAVSIHVQRHDMDVTVCAAHRQRMHQLKGSEDGDRSIGPAELEEILKSAMRAVRAAMTEVEPVPVDQFWLVTDRPVGEAVEQLCSAASAYRRLHPGFVANLDPDGPDLAPFGAQPSPSEMLSGDPDPQKLSTLRDLATHWIRAGGKTREMRRQLIGGILSAMVLFRYIHAPRIGFLNAIQGLLRVHGFRDGDDDHAYQRMRGWLIERKERKEVLTLADLESTLLRGAQPIRLHWRFLSVPCARAFDAWCTPPSTEVFRQSQSPLEWMTPQQVAIEALSAGWAEGAPLVVLVGAGGNGKSVLAAWFCRERLEALERLSENSPPVGEFQGFPMTTRILPPDEESVGRELRAWSGRMDPVRPPISRLRNANLALDEERLPVLYLVVDGLDEVSSERAGLIADHLVELLTQNPQLRVLLTTRPDRYDPLRSTFRKVYGMVEVEVRGFTDIEPVEVIARAVPSLAQYLGTAEAPLGAAPGRLPLQPSEEILEAIRHPSMVGALRDLSEISVVRDAILGEDAGLRLLAAAFIRRFLDSNARRRETPIRKRGDVFLMIQQVAQADLYDEGPLQPWTRAGAKVLGSEALGKVLYDHCLDAGLIEQTAPPLGWRWRHAFVQRALPRLTAKEVGL